MIDQNADRGKYVDGMLIGLDALPDETSAGLRQRALPLEASAQNALDGAWRKWSSRWGERKLLTGHADGVTAVAFSPDGARLLTGCYDHTARLWDTATGETIATLKGPVTAVAFSPDGARVLTGSEDKTARLWDAATGKTVATLDGHTDRVEHVAFSPDGARVLTGSWDNTARLWDAATGKTVATLTALVSAVAFSPDGTSILTGSGYKTARLWDATTGKTLATLEGHTGPVLAVAFSPDGARVLTGSDDGTARLWLVFSSVQALVEEVKASAPRCLTLTQRESFHLGNAATAMVLYAQSLALRRCPTAAGGLGRVAPGRVGSGGGMVPQGARAEMKMAAVTY